MDDNILETVEMHVLELPRFNEDEIDELTKEEAWMAYFKGSNSKLIKKAKMKYQYINELDDLLIKYWKEEKI